MATITQVIRELLIRGRSEGLSEQERKLRDVAAAQGQVAVATEKTERASLSAQSRIDRLQKSLDGEYRASRQLESALKSIEVARAQGAISTARAADLSARAAAKYKVEGEAAARAAEGLRLLKEVSLGFVAGIGAGVLLGGLTELPTAIAEAVDKLGNTANVAETIGLTTKALQELRYAARLSDVEIGTLDDAMAKFSTNLGKADSPLRKILALNGVKVSGDVLKDLEHFADLVKNASNQEERNTIVTMAFGKSAQEMGRLFSEGGEGIARWAAEAQGAGAVLSDDKLQRARELNDELTRLKPQIEAAQNEFALMIAPAEISLLGAFNDTLRQTRDLFTDIGNLDLKGIAKIIGRDEGDHGSLFGKNGAFAIDWFGDGTAVTGNRDLLTRPTSNASGSPDDRGGNGGFTPTPALPAAGKPTIIPTTPDQAAAAAVKAYDTVVRSAKERIAQSRIEAEALGKTAVEADRLRFANDLLASATKDGTKLTAAHRAELNDLANQMAEAADRTRQLSDIYATGKAATSEFFSTLKSDLMQGTSLWGSLADAASKALDNIANKLLTNAANGVWDTLFNALLGGVTGSASSASFIPGGFVPGITGPRLHSGGVVGAGGTPVTLPASTWDDAPRYHGGGIAGLRPDEVPAILERGERVIPNGQSMGMAANGNSSGSRQVQVNVFNYGDSGVTARERPGSGGSIIDVVIGEVAKSMAKPGGKVHEATKTTFGLSQNLTRRG